MRSPTHRVLLAGMAGDEARPYGEALERTGFDVVVVAEAERASAMLEGGRFGAVVAAHPMPPGVLGRLLTILRGRNSVNNAAGLVLLAPADGLRAAASLVGRGVTRALSRSEDPLVLAVVIQRIVELGSVTMRRVPSQLEVVSAGDRTRWQTVDVSGFGMMVATRTPPAIGGDLRFTLELPSGPVSGKLRVVRHTTSERDGTEGFGARFLSLDGDGQRRLRQFLEAAEPDDGDGSTPAPGDR